MLTVAKPGGNDNKKKGHDSMPKYTGLTAKTIHSCRKVTELHHDLPLHLPLAAKDGKAHKQHKDE